MTTPPDSHQSPAWLLSGLTGSRAGTLKYANGRITYFNDEGRPVFDVQLQELTNVSFPWYYFSGGVKFTLGKEHCRLSFVRPNDAPGGGIGDIGDGRRAGKVWKSILLRRARSCGGGG